MHLWCLRLNPGTWVCWGSALMEWKAKPLIKNLKQSHGIYACTEVGELYLMQTSECRKGALKASPQVQSEIYWRILISILKKKCLQKLREQGQQISRWLEFTVTESGSLMNFYLRKLLGVRKVLYWMWWWLYELHTWVRICQTRRPICLVVLLPIA